MVGPENDNKESPMRSCCKYLSSKVQESRKKEDASLCIKVKGYWEEKEEGVCGLGMRGEVKEIVLSNNSGQIGVLPNHAPIATTVDIGILRIRLNGQWLTMALMDGFARIGNNEIVVLVNDAEKSSDIDPQEAQQTLEIAEAALRKAEGKRQTIETNIAL
ncbi:hypothetical protein E3N88_24989 [Mikania micrantha]|uniref:ATP synthase F1 complex delta/epsilon subunit N-terminal domain-containing protein n=1 Tax=Mikania micrantha TaxID=192012 RepID=A0A5N6N6A2_9ASTR|nr:hypothetical protein E3N88_24989 [Mikania micrantha]